MAFALLRVIDRAINHPHAFTSWRSEHVRGELDPPVGEVHPEIVEAVPTPPDDIVTVGHTSGRGEGRNRLPSHNIGCGPAGHRFFYDTLVLDARWQGRDARITRSCSGHCFEVAMCTNG